MTNTTPVIWLAVPCLQDNYSWVVHAKDETIVFDVPEAAPVAAALAERGWHADHIVLTHHHADHIQGVAALAGPATRIWGNKADAARLPPLTDPLWPGATVTLAGLRIEVLDAPGHTLGHVDYHLPEAGLAITGDSLMSWGCGRLFEGTPAQMFDTLARVAALPADTLICSGHEYTEANGRFALSLEPDHPALRARMADVQALRAEGRPTLPVPLSLERATNPFLRSVDPLLQHALGLTGADPLAVFTEARARKDRF